MGVQWRDGLLVVADDLSGAMETAAALGGLVSVGLDWQDPGDVAVVDADSRRHPESEVTERLASVLGVPARVRLVKIDSLLRGHVRTTVAVLREQGRSVVVCPALPLLSREVRNGVVVIDGKPLHETNLWHVEPTAPPASILELLPTGAHVVAAAEVARWLREEPGCILVPDASTQNDVRTIVDAVRLADGPVDLVGGSELARQWAALSKAPEPPSTVPESTYMVPEPPSTVPEPTSTVPESTSTVPESTSTVPESTSTVPESTSTVPELVEGTEPAEEPHPQLFLLGSAAHVVREQADALGPNAARVALTAQDLQGDPALAGRHVAEALGPDRSTVVQVPQGTGGVVGTELTRWLAGLVAAADAARPDLFLCGGETARTVLDELGIGRLDVFAECHPGAALAVADDGRLVCTRPGSHGPRDSLLTIHRAMCAARNPSGSDVLQNKE